MRDMFESMISTAVATPIGMTVLKKIDQETGSITSS
jgi:hypothetical protein